MISPSKSAPFHLTALLTLIASVTSTAVAQVDGFFISPAAVQDDIDVPVNIAFLPNGKLLIAERTGEVWFKSGGVLEEADLLFTITDTGVEAPSTERGIHSITVDPRYATGNGENDFLYVSRTKVSLGICQHPPGTPEVVAVSDVVSRFSFPADWPNSPVGNEQILWQSDWYCNGTHGHYGGDIDFVNGDPDLLYVALGDHGPEIASVQNPTRTVGKVLRLRRDRNPLTDPQPEIWAMGLRNPFRCSVDPTSGALYIGNVGSNGECGSGAMTWEELNLAPEASVGLNFGWPCQEGPANPPPECHCRAFDHLPACVDPCAPYELPALAWNHAPGPDGGNCVIAGPVYQSLSATAFPPEYHDHLYVADYARGWIRRAAVHPIDGSLSAPQLFVDPGTLSGILDLEVHPINGGLYFVLYKPSHVPSNDPADRPSGVFRIGYNGRVAEATFSQYDPFNLRKVQFFAAGYGPETTFHWDFGDGNVSSERNPLHVYANRGQYRVYLVMTDGEDQVLANPLTVRAGEAPTITIVQPTNGSTYYPTESLECMATAFDEFGQPIVDPGSPSPFTWQFFWLHGEGEGLHEHPLQNTWSGQTVTIPPPGRLSGHESLDIKVKVEVRDLDGITNSLEVIIHPLDEVAINLAAIPSGPTLNVDGVDHPSSSPTVLHSPPGQSHSIAIPSSWNGAPFQRWRDGNTDNPRSFTVPNVPSELVAVYGANYCVADINGVDGVNSQDYLDFLSLYYSGAANCWELDFPTAIDLDSNCLINSVDFFAFLTAFFEPCGQ